MAYPSTLPNDSRCYNCEIPPGMERAVQIYLLAKLVQAGNGSFDITPASLINGAKCYSCEIPPGMELPVMNYLLNELLEETT